MQLVVNSKASHAGQDPAQMRTEPLAVDIAVVGGGPTGMTAALAAAKAGWRVALIAPDGERDPRTTALLMPSIAVLAELGVWPAAEPHAAPLATMRLVDATGRVPRAPEIAFDAHEVDLDQFGFNIANVDLNAAIAAQLDRAGVIRLREPAEHFQPGAPAVVRVPSGTVEAGLVVAADGAQSLIRSDAGIGLRAWQYDQSAFVTVLAHERPHGDTSTEFHTAAGPFTLVPLPGNRSSLVWVCRPEDAERYHAMDPGPLARAIEAQAHRILGHMRIDGPRGVIPMKGSVARRFGSGRVVLVGEAAHRFPPIGAQGLNLGIRDVAALQRVLARAKEDGTLAGAADRYDAERRLDVGLRTLGVDLLNRSLLSGLLPVTILRTLGLSAARGIGPVRRTLMRFGLGARGTA